METLAPCEERFECTLRSALCPVAKCNNALPMPLQRVTERRQPQVLRRAAGERGEEALEARGQACAVERRVAERVAERLEVRRHGAPALQLDPSHLKFRSRVQ